MDPISSIGRAKKAVEKITDVGEDGETFAADYEITFVFKELHRSEYLRIARAAKLGQPCGINIHFLQSELIIQDGTGDEWRLPG